ncbi:hypothetical protein B0T17DRAFT_532004 [Bombardia bombarda]|uniref:Uncharacterized protein n=1 Tax=Bombardia bombarda TaxID=252184 RepID=A0AA40C4I8_9PEZI|nr:hypothetical protein B0T17DRAFT_532004 [Bombardia bombarda]
MFPRNMSRRGSLFSHACVSLLLAGCVVLPLELCVWRVLGFPDWITVLFHEQVADSQAQHMRHQAFRFSFSTAACELHFARRHHYHVGHLIKLYVVTGDF